MEPFSTSAATDRPNPDPEPKVKPQWQRPICREITVQDHPSPLFSPDRRPDPRPSNLSPDAA